MEPKKLMLISVHLFWCSEARSYIIKNSSKRNIKNRQALKRQYLISLLVLIENFDKNNATQMAIQYLNRYSYRFLKGNGVITVYKILEGLEPFLWAHYPIGKLEHVEWDLMSLINIPEPYYSQSDIFREIVHWKQAQFCICCGELIRCETDTEFLTNSQKIAETEKTLSQLNHLKVLPICVNCMFKHSIITPIFREISKLFLHNKKKLYR